MRILGPHRLEHIRKLGVANEGKDRYKIVRNWDKAKELIVSNLRVSKFSERTCPPLFQLYEQFVHNSVHVYFL